MNTKKWVPTVIPLFKYYIHEYCAHFFSRRNFHFFSFPTARALSFLPVLSFRILCI